MSDDNGSDSNHRLIWIDLEMTGLEPQNNRIIEIATLVTDFNLNILAEGPLLAIHQPEAYLQQMDEWNTQTHTASGLIGRVRTSLIDEQEAERQTLAFLRQWVSAGSSPICGNTVGQDRRFLYLYMSELQEYFHYRSIDVSTLKELAIRWRPDILDGFKKESTHQAMEDIRDSVAELAYYRQYFIQG